MAKEFRYLRNLIVRSAIDTLFSRDLCKPRDYSRTLSSGHTIYNLLVELASCCVLGKQSHTLILCHLFAAAALQPASVVEQLLIKLAFGPPCPLGYGGILPSSFVVLHSSPKSTRPANLCRFRVR